MLTSPVGAVVTIAIAATACYAVYCATAHSMFKSAVSGSRSADRPQIIRQFGVLLRALLMLRRR